MPLPDVVVTTAALFYGLLAGGVVVFHLAMIVGAPWGYLTMGGRWPGRLPVPARLLPLASATLIVILAVIVLARAGIIAGPGWAGSGAAIGAALALSVVAVIANAATPSPLERRLWLPVTLLMLGAAVIVALA